MLLIEPPTSVHFSTAAATTTSLCLSDSARFFIYWKKFRGLSDSCGMRKCGWNCVRNRVRASVKKPSSSDSGPVKQNAKPQRYHPFEDISESELVERGETTLTAAETCRTIIEVNTKGTLMFSGLISDEIHENVLWPDLPYVTDEHGNVYFQVKNDEDIMQTLTSEDNLVQVIIGIDTAEVISEMELLDQSGIDFGVEEIDDEDTDIDEDDDEEDEDEDGDYEDDNYEEDWVSILEHEGDHGDSNKSIGDWAKLETMSSSHPMYFAKKLSEVVSDDPIDFMDQPPAVLTIQGFLRPAFIEEHSAIQKHVSEHQSSDIDVDQLDESSEDKHENLGMINGHRQETQSSQWHKELEKEESMGNGISFYKLEMIKIQLISAHGHQSLVEVEDFSRARPDAIAHAAAKIISRFKAGGEKTTQALKSLCWRCKGIQVEEVALIGVDSLGFDLRVCSGRQVQTLRFAFNKQGPPQAAEEERSSPNGTVIIVEFVRLGRFCGTLINSFPSGLGKIEEYKKITSNSYIASQ